MNFFPFLLLALVLASSKSRNSSSNNKNAQVKVLLDHLEGNSSLKTLTEEVRPYDSLFFEEEIYLKTPNALRIDLAQLVKDGKKDSSKVADEFGQAIKLSKLVVVCVKQHFKTQDPMFVLTALLQVETLAGVVVRSDSYKKSLLLKQIGRCRTDILDLLTNTTLYKKVLILSSYTFDYRIHELALTDASVAAFFPTQVYTFEYLFEHFPFFIHSQNAPQFAVRGKLFVLLTSKQFLRDCIGGAKIPEVVFRWFRCVASVWQLLSEDQLVVLLLHVFESGHDNKLFLSLFEPLLDDRRILHTFQLYFPGNSPISGYEVAFFSTLANPRMKHLFLISRFPLDLARYSLDNMHLNIFGAMSGRPDVLERTLFRAPSWQ